MLNVDVNECSTSNGGCDDLCINTAGAFFCFCLNPGFSLGSDGLSCDGNYESHKM